jgi:hypothetical protein
VQATEQRADDELAVDREADRLAHALVGQLRALGVEGQPQQRADGAAARP